MDLVNESRRYIVTPDLIGLAHTQNDPWNRVLMHWSFVSFLTQTHEHEHVQQVQPQDTMKSRCDVVWYNMILHAVRRRQYWPDLNVELTEASHDSKSHT